MQDGGHEAVQDTSLVRMEIAEAAAHLGITPDGVRKRIRRGQLAAVKQDGRWYVVLDESRETGQAQSARQAQDHLGTDDTDEPEALHPSTAKLVATLEAEVVHLRAELDRRATEIEQLHVIVAQLTERVPRRLEAPTASDTEPPVAAQPAQRSWWRHLWPFGRPAVPAV